MKAAVQWHWLSKRLGNNSQKEELSECCIYKDSIWENNIINGRVNNFKNTMKTLLAFTQGSFIELLMRD